MKINLLGTGYVGQALANALLQDHDVQACYTSPETKQKIEALRGKITAHLFQLKADEIVGNLDFLNTDILIITLPFSRKLEDPFSYPTQLHYLINTILHNNHHPWIIFTSSTGIYSGSEDLITEETVLEDLTPRQQALREAELAIIKSGLDYTILRLGGIYGPDREILNFFKNKTEVVDGPVNFIHRDDIVMIIIKIIKLNVKNEIFNVVSDEHPLKSDLYLEVSRLNNVKCPIFLKKDSNSKIIDNLKIKLRLDIF